MAFNDQWIPDLWASITKHFTDNAGSLTMYFEGDVKDTSLQNYVEVMMTGPVITPLPDKQYYLDCQIITLVRAAGTDQDKYRIRRDCGLVVAIYGTIPILATDVPDDPPQIGCLELLGQINVRHLGRLQAAVDLVSASVDARFRWTVSE